MQFDDRHPRKVGTRYKGKDREQLYFDLDDESAERVVWLAFLSLRILPLIAAR